MDCVILDSSLPTDDSFRNGRNAVGLGATRLPCPHYLEIIRTTRF